MILPPPGEPLDVRKLYIEVVRDQRPARTPRRAPPWSRPRVRVSFATYFNAFPASYWRRWSTLESVVLRVRLTGSAGWTSTGPRRPAPGSPSAAPGSPARAGPTAVTSLNFEDQLDPFGDGGWIWFDITTDSAVHRPQRGVVRVGARPGRADMAVGIPTFNRPGDCVNALTALTSDPLVDRSSAR